MEIGAAVSVDVKVEESKELYVVPFEVKKLYSVEELQEIRQAFKQFDKNKDATMDKGELKASKYKLPLVLVALGEKDVSEEQVAKLTAAVDFNNDSVIQFSEFLELYRKLVSSKETHNIEKLTTKEGVEINKEEGKVGSFHTFAEEEKVVFVQFINENLKGDEQLGDMLPINSENMDLFHSCDDGILLCKLVNLAEPGIIDPRAIKVKKNLNLFDSTANLKLGIESAKSIGCRIVSVGPENFIKKQPHLILGVVWQVIRIAITRSIGLKDVPEIANLLQEGEELQDLLKLNPEQILTRWLNFHLKKSGTERRVNNLGGDLKDQEVFLRVLHQLDNSSSLEALEKEDVKERAQATIDGAKIIGAKNYMTAREVAKGNAKINTVFVSSLFNAKHGLPDLNADMYEAAKMLDDDVEGTQEERAYRMWINSLNIDGVFCNNLYEDGRDGIMHCKILEHLKPGVIEMKALDLKAKNKFSRSSNCSKIIGGAKALGLKIVGVDGTDFADAKRKMILAVVWQMMRFHYLSVIGGKTEEQVLDWANGMVKDEKFRLSSFKDKSAVSGQFYIHLCAGIEPRSVDWDIVQAGEDEEQQMNNAKYALSIARKLGATVFCVWEDLAKANSKWVFIFTASLLNTWEIMVEAKKG